MTIYKTLLDTSLSYDQLVTRLDTRLSKGELQNLSKVFGLSPAKKTKEKMAQEIVTHIQDSLHPRLDQFRKLASEDQYQRTISEVELYLYSKTKRPDEELEVPLIFTQIPDIEEQEDVQEEEDIEFLEDDEDTPSIRPSKTIEETYSQFSVLYFIEQLEKGDNPRLSEFKSYIINEAAIARPDRTLLQSSYQSLREELKSYSTQEEKLRYLQSKLPSISRSASPERTFLSSARGGNGTFVEEEPEEEIVSEEEVEIRNPSLDQGILMFLRDQYESGATILIQNVRPYLRRMDITSYSPEVIRERYDHFMNLLKGVGKKRDVRLEQVQTWLSEINSEEDEPEIIEVEEEDEPDTIVSVEEEEQDQEESEPELVQLPPSELETKVEAPEVCNVMETHANLEELAGDLTCSEGKICNVDEQVCVLPTPETVITSLQVGDKMLPITGKSDSDVVRDIKKEIVSLTAQLQRKERTNRDKLLELKKFISTPVDLDKLYSSLRSYQSSQQLYTQQKAQQANQELRDKIKKCLFL